MLFRFLTITASVVCLVHGDKVHEEIKNKKDDVNKIIEYILHGGGKGKTYQELGDFTDEFGHRLSGSAVLEDSIDHMKGILESEGFDNVHKEPVKVRKWIRGAESATLVEPKFPYNREKKMQILGLGSSIGTPVGGLQAEVLVVKSFDELEVNSLKAKDKIVVYNNQYLGYGSTVQYRSRGATEASKHGAVAALVKSIASGTMYTPHTGQQGYDPTISEPIPAACLTIEDVEMLQRMQDRGETIVINITMEAQNFDDSDSFNLIADITGTVHPKEVVFFGGHIDSWDVGNGVMDDGGGLVMSWQALKVIKELNLEPKRTLRFIAWTGEEQGLYGGIEYHRANKDKINVSLAMESDAGTFTPHGIGFTGAGLPRSYIQEALNLLSAVTNATAVGGEGSGGSPDVGKWIDDGVPAANLWNGIDDEYFYYHHTEADMLTVYDTDTLDTNTMIWATVAYVVADLDEMLPRTGDAPVTVPPATDPPTTTVTNAARVVGCQRFSVLLLVGVLSAIGAGF